MTKPDQFDCVEMKRAGAIQVREATKDLSPEQQVEFWKQQTAALRRLQTEAIAKQARKSA